MSPKQAPRGGDFGSFVDETLPPQTDFPPRSVGIAAEPDITVLLRQLVGKRLCLEFVARDLNSYVGDLIAVIDGYPSPWLYMGEEFGRTNPSGPKLVSLAMVTSFYACGSDEKAAMDLIIKEMEK